MDKDSTLDHLFDTCYSVRSDIEFLHGLWVQHIEISKDTLDELEYARLEEILPDINEQDYPDVWFAFTEAALEMKANAMVTTSWQQGVGQPTLKNVELVLGTGGPHIEVVADYASSRLEVRGYWSNESCTVQIDAESLYDHMINYGEEMLSVR